MLSAPTSLVATFGIVTLLLVYRASSHSSNPLPSIVELARLLRQPILLYLVFEAIRT